VWAAGDGAVLADSDETVAVEGNHYFPPESLRREHVVPSRTRTLCFWKGLARYYTITVDGLRRQDGSGPWPVDIVRQVGDVG
jgi:uncharacterized protein (DUF427 family)